MRENVRREITTSAREDGDVDVVARGDLTHQAAEAVVELLGEGIEFLGLIEGDDGDFALGRECDCLLR